MQNLNLQNERRCEIPLPNNSGPVVDFCDTEGSSRVLLTSDGYLLRCCPTTSRLIWTSHVAAEVNNDDSSEQTNNWFRVVYAAETQSLLCLGRDGSIVAVALDSGDGELVGELEGGLAAAAWDGNLLLLVTREMENQHTVVLTMNAEFHVLAEVDCGCAHDPSRPVYAAIRPSDSRLCAISSVDAGEGKASMRKIRFFQTDGLVWQGLGRTEDGSGTLAPHLTETPLAWAGTACSQLLATVQTKGRSRRQVAFFEPNGLRHGEFLLRQETVVQSLVWNANSDLLALVLTTPTTPTSDKIQLWHRRNYHWYLKREIHCRNARVATVVFDEQRAYTLWVAETTGHWTQFTVRWVNSTVAYPCQALVVDGKQLSVTPLDRAVLPPPMSAATLTLPDAVNELALAGLTMDDDSSNVCAILVLASGDWVVVRQPKSISGKNMRGWKPPTASDPVSVPTHEGVDLRSLRCPVIESATGTSVQVVAAALDATGSDCIVVLSLSLVGDPGITVESILTVPHPILSIAPWRDAVGAVVQLDNGHIFEYASQSLTPSLTVEPFLEPCPWMVACQTVRNADQEPTRLVVGRTAKGRLYCQDVLLAESVFSLAMNEDHVSWISPTDGEDHLFLVHLSQLASLDPLLGMEEHQRVVGQYPARPVERGARLVAIHTPTVVLQLPRGNLEAIYPRALVLRECRIQVVEHRRYGPTLFQMRRQKINLNWLVDVDPKAFLEEGGIELLVDQVVPTVDYLNLFISSLQNWDSTAELYPTPSWSAASRDAAAVPAFDFSDKVNRVCQTLRSVMIQATQDGQTCSGKTLARGSLLLPILSTFAKEDPPKIEDALSLIRDHTLASHPNHKSSKKPVLFSETAQSAIKYLAFLADYELLFDRALGQYDYDMARAVARNSQMDPKVYLPLLKRYKELPEAYAKYEVDVRLNRHESALTHLAQSLERSEQGSVEPLKNSLEDCLQFMDAKKLHRLGLELFPSQARRILLALGDELLEQKDDQAALHLFLLASPLDVTRAQTAALRCRDWATYFSLPDDKDDAFVDDRRRLSARNMADRLVFDAETAAGEAKVQLLHDAATVLLDYGKDSAGAVDLWIRAQQWKQAHRVALRQGESSSSVVEAVVAAAQGMLQELAERQETLQTSMDRYDVVLDLRRQAVAAGEEEDVNNAAEADDTGSLFSTASSTASNTSVRSTGSAASHSSIISVRSTTTFSLSGADVDNRHNSKYNQRGKKKKQKKPRKGRSKTRAGSQAELIEVVGSIRSSCPDAFYAKSIQDTISFLSQHGQLVLARSLYESYNELSKAVAAALLQRKQKNDKDRLDHQARVRREGFDGRPFVTLEIEKEVHRLVAPPLASFLTVLFDSLPSQYDGGSSEEHF